MIDVEELGWNPKTVGELDHRLLRAPTLKLRSLKSGNSDTIYCIDLRIRRPNADQYLSPTELHSVEHFLLEGFQRNLPDNFVSVGIMGCRTGFYLVFSNEGRAARICSELEDILTRMQHATAVPYARIDQCGDYRNHNLALAQDVAREVLKSKATWLDAV